MDVLDDKVFLSGNFVASDMVGNRVAYSIYTACCKKVFQIRMGSVLNFSMRATLK